MSVKRPLVAAAIVAGALLAGCGSGSSGKQSDVPSVVETTPASPKPAEAPAPAQSAAPATPP